MSTPGNYGQQPGGAPQWGQPQQGFDPNQTQGFGAGQPFGQPGQPQQYGQQQQFGQPGNGQWGQPAPQAPKPKQALPYTLREMILMGVAVLMFVFSFFPVFAIDYGFGSATTSLWGMGLFGVILALLPLVPAGFLAARPFSGNFQRVGSLSFDQFASVIFSVLLAAYLGIGTAGFSGWASWILLVLALGGVALTVGGPFIFKAEFDQRPDENAPRAGRTKRPIPAGQGVSLPANMVPDQFAAASQNPYGQAPAPQQAPAQDWNQTQAQPAAQDWNQSQAQPAAQDWNQSNAQPVANWGQQAPQYNATEAAPAEAAAPAVDFGAPAAETAAEEVVVEEAPADEAAPAEAVAAVQQSFWALVPDERAVVDQNGAELFRVGPTAWALVIEDRGSSFVIRHEDGRTGVLNDVSGVVRNA